MRFFVDSDGVIFDMEGHSRARFGAGTRDTTFTTEDGTVLTGDAALWANIDNDPDYWVTMPKLPDADELLDFLQQHGDVTVLTGCPKHALEFTADQKRIKYQKHYPHLPLITCLAKDKATHMIEPSDILIDDFSSNTKRWRRAGGIAIDHRSAAQTITEIKALLDPTHEDV